MHDCGRNADSALSVTHTNGSLSRHSAAENRGRHLSVRGWHVVRCAKGLERREQVEAEAVDHPLGRKGLVRNGF